MAATQLQQPEVLRLLLAQGATEVDVTGGEDQSTPLINAARNMGPESVEMLLRKGADPNARNPASDTALIVAALRGEKAAVESLCSFGADITYRSPRGLPIDVATLGGHTLCADFLAAEMNKTINVTQDTLKETRRELKEKDLKIEALEGMLEESKEQLEIASKEVDLQKHEKERLLSESNLQGETYEAIFQQMHSMRTERAELTKQLDSYRGQMNLAKDNARHFQALLNEEKKTNAALRERRGYAALQEQKQALENELQAAREKVRLGEQAAAERARLDAQRHNDLDQEKEGLKGTIADLEEKLNATRAAAAEAEKQMEALRELNRELQEANGKMQEEAQLMHDTLASLRSGQPKGNRALRPLSPANTNDDYFAPQSTIFDEERLSQSPRMVASPPPPQSNGASTPPGSPGMSPRKPYDNGDPLISPGSFRTAHGLHRSDGSFGGYRRHTSESVLHNGGARRKDTGSSSGKRSSQDSLYATSVRRESTAG